MTKGLMNKLMSINCHKIILTSNSIASCFFLNSSASSMRQMDNDTAAGEYSPVGESVILGRAMNTYILEIFKYVQNMKTSK